MNESVKLPEDIKELVEIVELLRYFTEFYRMYYVIEWILTVQFWLFISVRDTKVGRCY